MEKPIFELLMLEDAVEFLASLPASVQDKIAYNIKRVRFGLRDAELFKKLEGTDIWEFRTLYEGKAYRLFSFWDTKRKALVIATHGIIKKKQKTPAKEIAKAEELRRRYLAAKSK